MSDSTRRNFFQLTVALNKVRQISELETQGLGILLEVMAADPEPLTVGELMSNVGISHGSVIRYLRILGSDDDHPRGGECLGLVQCFRDPNDKRRKLVTLSHKGRLLRTKMQYNLECMEATSDA